MSDGLYPVQGAASIRSPALPGACLRPPRGTLQNCKHNLWHPGGGSGKIGTAQKEGYGMEPILQVEHLQKYYGVRGSVTRAIDDISF